MTMLHLPFFYVYSEYFLLTCHVSFCSIGGQFIPLAPYVPTGPDALRSRAQEQPTDKTVKELADLDPFVDMVSSSCFLASARDPL